jgi:hypothetical protein
MAPCLATQDQFFYDFDDLGFLTIQFPLEVRVHRMLQISAQLIEIEGSVSDFHLGGSW